MKILDGKALSKKIKVRLKKEVEIFNKSNIPPHLVAILVGNDVASTTYVNIKQRECTNIKMNSTVKKLPYSISTKELLSIIKELNQNDGVNGILVQLPLPKHINSSKIIKSISPKKDVDGFHPLNVGSLSLGIEDKFMACTPLGIIKLLDFYHINIKGEDICIVGASNIVGKPLFNMLINRHASVSLTHSFTKDLTKYTKKASILISATGKYDLIQPDMVKDLAVVVDVGIQKNRDGKIVGDVNFEEVSKKCSYITPVPGGVGPMTIAVLLENTLKAAKLKIKNRATTT